MLVAFICFKICGVCCIPLLCLNLSSMAAKKVIKTAMKTKQQKLEKPKKAEKAEKPTTATLFDVTIKSNYMAHVILQSREENPRSSWCYGGEHLMADFKKLESLCTKANKPEATSKIFSFKYACFWHFQATESGVDTWLRTVQS